MTCRRCGCDVDPILFNSTASTTKRRIRYGITILNVESAEGREVWEEGLSYCPEEN
jgi:hypothetical protein